MVAIVFYKSRKDALPCHGPCVTLIWEILISYNRRKLDSSDKRVKTTMGPKMRKHTIFMIWETLIFHLRRASVAQGFLAGYFFCVTRVPS